MSTADNIKIIILAWVLPLVLVMIVQIFTPDPYRSRGSFPSAEFKPSEITTANKKERMGADYFELWLHNPNGEKYFHRDPSPEPISELWAKIPASTELKVIYTPTIDGNVLMEISRDEPKAEPLLSFEKVMGEYASRRRVVYVVAGSWFLLGTLFYYALRRVKLPSSSIG